MDKKKKVILTIIDSFHPQALHSCLQAGSVPAFRFLIERGFLRNNCISVFPTMTPTACSSIVTGSYPKDHQVPGFIWFSDKEKRIVNYGATLWAILKTGIYQTVQDLLFNLNKQQLSKKTKTIFESLEEDGFSTAAINLFIYRGTNSFSIKVPWWFKLLTHFKIFEGLLGPKILFFGEICKPDKIFKNRDLNLPMGAFNKFGVNDEFSGIVGSQIIKEGLQPDFMLIYLPDTDYDAHRTNPRKVVKSLIKADFQLQRMLNSFASWEQALRECVFIIVGDHAQNLINSEEDFAIDLPLMLEEFSQAKLGKKMFLKKDIAICPNERMAHIYIFKDKEFNQIKIIEKLKQDPRIDQIAWQETENDISKNFVARGGEPEKTLEFWKDGPLKDAFGISWGIKGDLSVVDASVKDGSKIIYKDYPDALMRIAGILECEAAGQVIVTSRPGYEIGGEAAPLHPGCGSHGSLYKEDSLVPLIVAGSDDFQGIRKITDITPTILNFFKRT